MVVGRNLWGLHPSLPFTVGLSPATVALSSRGGPSVTAEQHPGKSQVEENKHNQPGIWDSN